MSISRGGTYPGALDPAGHEPAFRLRKPDNGIMNPLALLFIISFLVFVDIRILTPVLPSISDSLGSSPGAVGLAMTTYSFAYGLGQLVFGPISDRAGRIPVVRAASIGFCVFTILSALTVTTWQFIGARLLVGAFAGGVIPITLVFIADTVEYERRQAVLGRFAMITSSALAFSASIGGAIAHFISWRFMLLGYGLLALIPICLLWRIKTPPPTGGADASIGFMELLRDRRAQFVYIAVFLEGTLCWGGMTYLGSFATARYGLDQFIVGLLVALFGIGMMTGGFLMGRIRRRLSENGMATLGGALMGGTYLALIPQWPAVTFAVCMFLMGLGYVSLHTTLQLRGTEIHPAARGKAFSLFAFTLFSGIATGSALFGRLVDAGRYDTMFVIAGFGLIAIGLATTLSPPHNVSGSATSSAMGMEKGAGLS
jgi:predicted MFS family arabinose efflux permease